LPFAFFKQIASYYCFAIFLGKKKDFDIAQKKQKARPDPIFIFMLAKLEFLGRIIKKSGV